MGVASPTSAGGAQRLALDAIVAVVTGGSRGIGLAIARAFVAGGARVVITGRDRKHLAAAAAAAPGIHAVRADVGRPDEATAAVDAAVEQFGGLDVLVNNAGVAGSASVAEMAVETWRGIIDTNLSGAFYCSRAALPHLRRRGGGWIVNISSLAGRHPFAGGAAYCASKAGLNAFSEALMQEVRYDNIRVSCIMPGSVATGFGGREEGAAQDWKIAPEDVAEIVIDLVTFPSRGLPSAVELRPSRPKKS
jgi:3-oxoacyl-[acyl-carrier protein] reductase